MIFSSTLTVRTHTYILAETQAIVKVAIPISVFFTPHKLYFLLRKLFELKGHAAGIVHEKTCGNKAT